MKISDMEDVGSYTIRELRRQKIARMREQCLEVWDEMPGSVSHLEEIERRIAAKREDVLVIARCEEAMEVGCLRVWNDEKRSRGMWYHRGGWRKRWSVTLRNRARARSMGLLEVWNERVGR